MGILYTGVDVKRVEIVEVLPAEQIATDLHEAHSLPMNREAFGLDMI